MASNSVSRLARSTLRKPSFPLLTRAYRTNSIRNQIRTPFLLFNSPAPRTFAVSSRCAGLMPHAEDPPVREAESQEENPSQKTQITNEEYHDRSDQFLESLLSKLEARQEEKGDIDVEYSAGVLSVDMGEKGTYILNKQPPNKQIWLSSPITGPKRFDWVLLSEGQDMKEGSGAGDWVYIKDNTSLTELVKEELGVTVDLEPEL
ncbi:hypothetical protein EG328_000354 [Venturia inaequalis]|uniref:ferroxidase n=1 Tax=Venturia inaequalis TaxID=5025 RepID=A0A8H3UJ88_VENIN|nr:hypothetical protein EG327_010006 [Venturia inaequalis]KAE9980326.1 hypothetical protein EG328_000354 [Venturia inaequalis]